MVVVEESGKGASHPFFPPNAFQVLISNGHSRRVAIGERMANRNEKGQSIVWPLKLPAHLPRRDN